MRTIQWCSCSAREAYFLASSHCKGLLDLPQKLRAIISFSSLKLNLNSSLLSTNFKSFFTADDATDSSGSLLIPSFIIFLICLNEVHQLK